MPKKTECRHCGVAFTYEKEADLPCFPFCSRRCKLLDLGLWLDEEHRIEEPIAEAEDADLPVGQDEAGDQ